MDEIKFSQDIDESLININHIKRDFVYSIETLLKFYQPLNIPKNIFKLETATLKNDAYLYSNSNRNNNASNQHVEKKYRNWQFNNNQIRASSHSDGSNLFNSSRVLSWRKGLKASNKQEDVNGNLLFNLEKNNLNEINKVLEFQKSNNCETNLLTDLEKDMSSIEKILNDRFNKSLDSEQFIRNKLVMALEGKDEKEFREAKLSNITSENTINAHETFSNEFKNNKIFSDVNANRSVVNFNNLMQKVSASTIYGNVLNNNEIKLNNNSIKNNIKSLNSIKISDANKNKSNLTNYQSPNRRRINNQIIQNNVNCDAKPELEILDRPIWLYKESGTSTVYGPHSTKYMSNLWKNYTFTHKTLFTTILKYIWYPINFYYPEVRTTFTYIPDLDVISRKLTQDSNSNGHLEKIKTEDISSIISEINELQQNVENVLSPPKLTNQGNNRKTDVENSNSKFDSIDSQDLTCKLKSKPEELKNKSEIVLENQFEIDLKNESEVESKSGPNIELENELENESLIEIHDTSKIESEDKLKIEIKNELSTELKDKSEINLINESKDVKPTLSNNSSDVPNKINNNVQQEVLNVSSSATLSSNIKLPWGLSSNNLNNKKEVIRFENVLKEQEDFIKKSLQKEQVKPIDNSENTTFVPKGWRITSPKIPIVSSSTLDITGNSILSEKNKRLSDIPQTNINKNSTNKWKGWGNSVVVNDIDNILNDDFCLINQNKQGFWEVCKSESKQNDRLFNQHNVKKVADVDSKSHNEPLEEKTNNQSTQETNCCKQSSNNKQRNKRKKGKKVDSSLLAFGIRSERQRNLNYDLD